MIKKIFLSIIIFVLLNLCAVYADTEKREFSYGTVYIEYSRFIVEQKSKEQIEFLKNCADCPGIDGYLPKYSMEKISIKIRNDTFIVPHTLTNDLYNPHIGPDYVREALNIESKSHGIILKFSGGDGTGSYKAIFDIDLIDQHVKRSIYQYPDFEKPTIEEANIVYEP